MLSRKRKNGRKYFLKMNERKHIIDPQSGKLVEGKREVAVVTANGAVGEVLSTSLFVADARQRELLKVEFCPRLILDL